MDAVDHQYSCLPWSDPLAPPDSRWHRACCVQEQIRLGRRRRRRSDPDWLRPLVGLADSLKPPARRRHRRRESVAQDLASAYRLYENHGPSRWEIEARILAAQTDDEIAASTDLPAEVVSQFERSFYNVRDQLAAKDFILVDVIGYRPYYGIREGDWRTLWGYFGFAAGPKMLEVIMAVSRDRPLPRWAVESAPSSADLDALIHSTKMAILATTAPITANFEWQLVLLQMQLLDLRQKRCANESLTSGLGAALVNDLDLGDLLVAQNTSPAAESEPKERELAAVA